MLRSSKSNNFCSNKEYQYCYKNTTLMVHTDSYIRHKLKAFWMRILVFQLAGMAIKRHMEGEGSKKGIFLLTLAFIAPNNMPNFHS